MDYVAVRTIDGVERQRSVADVDVDVSQSLKIFFSGHLAQEIDEGDCGGEMVSNVFVPGIVDLSGICTADEFQGQ